MRRASFCVLLALSGVRALALDRSPFDAMRAGRVQSGACGGVDSLRVGVPGRDRAMVAADGTYRLGGLPVGVPVRVEEAAICGGGVLSSAPVTLDAGNGYSAAIDLTLPPAGKPPVFDLDLTGPGGTRTVVLPLLGSKAQLSLSGRDVQGQPYPGGVLSNPAVMLESAQPGVAAVSPAAEVTSLSPGLAWLRLTGDGQWAQALVHVDLSFDTDRDGMPDAYEVSRGFNPNNPADALADADGDGLRNGEEFALGTDPRNSDTDEDLLPDAAEILAGTDPRNGDTDGDTSLDGAEPPNGADPLNPNERPGPPFTPAFRSSENLAQVGVRAALSRDDTLFILTNDGRLTAYGIDLVNFFLIFRDVETMSADVRDVALEGTTAYVAAGSAGLVLANVSNPAVITRTSVIGGLGSVQGVRVQGGTVYLATDAGLRILRPGAGGALETVGTLPLPVFSRFALSGHLAFLGVPSLGRVVCVNVANPANPVEVSRLLLPASVSGFRAVEAAGPFVYVAHGAAGLFAVSAADPAVMQIVDSSAPDFPLAAFDAAAVHGNRLYAHTPGSNTRIQILRVADDGTFSPAGDVGNNTAGATQIVANQHYVAGLSATSFAVSQVLERSDRLTIAPTGNILVERNLTELTPGGSAGVFARLRDDVFLANVEFFVDGQLVLHDAFPPFRYVHRAPLSRPAPYLVSISAVATDLRQNRATFSGVVLFVREDLDGDLVPDSADPDQDGDGASDLEELYPGADGFISDPRSADTDGDGIGDGEESIPGADTFITNAGSIDTDQDGLTDPYEIAVTITHPARADTDGDGIADGDEDIDSDGLANRDELRLRADPRNPDTDADGLPDGLEVALGLDPTRPDSDGDGIADGDEDFDGDTVENRREAQLGTDPLKADTDGDGFDDAAEASMGTDPVVATDFSTRAITFTGRNVTLRGPVTVAALSLTSSVLTVPSGSGAQVVPLELTVTGTLSVAAGSRIDANGKGCAGGRGPGNPGHLGTGPQGVAPGGELTGGSHGGTGGLAGGPEGPGAQPAFGDFRQPGQPGGGGSASAAGATRGGSGGGVLRIQAGRLIVNGAIAANGEGAPGGAVAGAGAGGSIVIRCTTLQGAGVIEANGGSATQAAPQAGGGGGGRVAIHAAQAGGFDLTRITAHGGGVTPGPDQPNANAGAGTVYLAIGAGDVGGHLVIDGGGRAVSAPRTPLVAGPGGEVRLDRLTVRGKARVQTSTRLRLDAEVGPLGLDDGELDSGPLVLGAASVVEVGGGRLLLDALESAAGRLAVIELNGCFATVHAALDVESLDLNASRLEAGGEVRADAVNLAGAILSVVDPDAAGYTPLVLDVADTITIDAGSRIDIAGKGFVGGYRGGSTDPAGQSSGGFSGEPRTGGGHAALGGLADSGAGAAQGVHGSLEAPDLPGGGGGAEPAANPALAPHRGGNGGGVLHLSAATLVLEGTIDASGAGAETPALFDSDRAGAGAGGSILLDVGAIRGAGRITAAGGSARGTASAHGGAGSGGRIALHYADRSGFTGTLSCPGGTLLPGPATLRAAGGAGTVFELEHGSGRGSLTVDGFDRKPRGDLTVLSGTSPLFLDRLVVRGGARVDSERTLSLARLDAGAATRWTLRGGLRGPRLELPAVELLDIDGGELDQLAIVSETPGLGSLQVRGGGTLRLSSPLSARSIALSGSSRITVRAPTAAVTHAVDLTVAETVTIDAGSLVDVAALGYLGGGRGDNASRLGQTADHVTPGAGGRTGGSHGGTGGFQAVGAGLGVVTAPAFDDFTQPSRPGGGGSARTNDPAELGYNGGGLVRLKAKSLVLNGRIDAQGDGRQRTGNTDLGGGGAGGGIALDVETLSGGGQIVAEGGSADGGAGAGAGGGGRIAIRYLDRSGFTGTVQAFGGTLVPAVNKPSSVGGAGTVYWKSAAQGFGDLVVDAGNRGQSTLRTPIRPVGGGSITSLTATVLGASGSSFATGDTGLKGQWVVVNNATATPFRIVLNSATSLTIDPATGSLTAVGAAGNPFTGAIVLDNLLVTNRAAMTTQGDLVIITTGTATVNNSATLTSPPVVHW